MTRNIYSLLLAGVVLVAFQARTTVAEKIDVASDEGTTPVVVADCDLTGYGTVTQTPNIAVPDNDPTGVRLGPLSMPASPDVVDGVVSDLKLSQTWVGDLIVTVEYDADGDTIVDASSVLMHRTGDAEGDCCGDSSDLDCANTLSFDNSATFGLIDAAAAAVAGAELVPAGCYVPGSIFTGGDLSVFNTLSKGGDWYLVVSDNAAGDTGNVCEWSVHYLSGPSPVENHSWSSVKSRYRD